MRCPIPPISVITLAFLLSACSQNPLQKIADVVVPEATPVPVEQPDDRVEYIVPEPEILPEEAEEEVVAVEDELPDPALQYGDLWKKIAANLNLPRHMDRKSVKGRLAWYAKNQEYLDRVSDRSRPYLYHIVTEVEKRGMPMELALLPIVESAFIPFAYSRSHASGIWQFIPSTGKIFGLKQNWWYDGRRDIVEATRGALDYLEKLSGDFDGDWTLALAAYNTGERNVERAVRRNKRAGKATDFFSLRLPRETRGYVPSLLAVAELVANPEQHGIKWKPVPDQPYFAQVDAGEQIDLAVVAELAGLSMDEMYTLNPAFNRWATDPNGPHVLLVPVAREAAFRERLAALAPEERVNWDYHQVQSGETLGRIAARYRTSVAALKSVNKLRGNVIHQGDTLRVAAPKEALKHYTLSVDGRRMRGLTDTGDGNKYVYTVKRGDTLWDIGKHYGVSVKQLTGWNGISARKYLRVGQKLTLWFAEDDEKAPAASRPATDPLHYIVKRGDSLWSIAKKFNVTVKQLLAWNKLRKNKYLYPNQKITVYQNGTASVDI